MPFRLEQTFLKLPQIQSSMKTKCMEYSDRATFYCQTKSRGSFVTVFGSRSTFTGKCAKSSTWGGHYGCMTKTSRSCRIQASKQNVWNISTYQLQTFYFCSKRFEYAFKYKQHSLHQHHSHTNVCSEFPFCMQRIWDFLRIRSSNHKISTVQINTWSSYHCHWTQSNKKRSDI